MAKNTGRWIKWGAIGCGGVVLLVLATFLITTLLTGVGYRGANQTRAVLDQHFDTQDEFTPAATIEADRLERFLEVRRSLQPLCAGVTKHQELFARLAGQGPQQDRTIVDALRYGRQILGVPFLIGRDFGDYVTRRNKVLLANEMGLGEYTWIYVSAYQTWLGHFPAKLFATADRPGIYEQRVNRQVQEMVARHVAGRGRRPRGRPVSLGLRRRSPARFRGLARTLPARDDGTALPGSRRTRGGPDGRIGLLVRPPLATNRNRLTSLAGRGTSPTERNTDARAKTYCLRSRLGACVASGVANRRSVGG